MAPLLFITPDRKFLYDGKKIKEVKKEKDVPQGSEIIFAKPMLVYDIEGINLSYLVENYGVVTVGELKLHELVQKLDWKDFILFVDHNRKTIRAFIRGGEELDLPYSSLDFLRYILAKFHSGILLESAEFEEIEMFSK
ncbi:hypothetical protein [Stygiolobus caldivivus]|uniref:Uncharacterized protein n=1 Tax=Stygiolobus caldivivus TaxID=2824673 RepID=A0A8D5U929_9CREN|nr:hypothetical protein [Stygiolobus caldivivus]BCU71487.1 hypothetical protein KN1_27840 [Stygiolobus caldivivus]